MARGIILLVLIAELGCTGGDPELLDCAEGDQALSNEIYVRWTDPNGCAMDADCVLQPLSVQCSSGATFGFCSRAIHVESTDAFRQTVAEAAGAVCPDIEPTCRSSALCRTREARCVAGRCEEVATSF